MTKLEIIERELTADELEFFGDKTGNLSDAMNEFAKQESICFKDWCDNYTFEFETRAERRFTTPELYMLYLQSKPKT